MLETPEATRAGQKVRERRGFLAAAAAAAAGLAAMAAPLLAGAFAFLDPLRRKGGAARFVRVATLNSLPDDGVARSFPVVSDRADAWNRYLNEPIGAVYLWREAGGGEVLAFNAVCPHAGCFVGYNAGAREFQCPCHNSRFRPDGARIDLGSSPSPRDLDRLEVDAPRLAQGEVWVKFMDFVIGIPEKRPR